MSCPFCRLKEKFSSIYIQGVNIPEEKQFGAWIDHDEDKYGNILWYAVLNGDQYVKGHTLVISGLHIVKITGNAIEESLKSIILGLNRVSKKLKEKLKCESVHVITLCEGQEHLHFHLIPRYLNEKNSEDKIDTPNHGYSDDERDFFVKKFWDRDKELFDADSKEKKFKDKDDYEKKIDYVEHKINERKHKIHGMWYAGYHEMNYKFINPNNPDEIEKRMKDLKELKILLRDSNFKKPKFLGI